MRYEVHGLKGMIRALKDVSDDPSWKTTGKLETVLASAYATTQARVHIITGRLKASGRTASDFTGKVWSGEVRYGGPKSTPAYYGIYEMHRKGVKPGLGPHDFYDGLEVYDPQFVAAIDSHFDPLKG